MTPDNAAWWQELERLATVGPEVDEFAEAEQFIADAERMTAAARALIAPRTTTPAKWRPPIQRYPARQRGQRL